MNGQRVFPPQAMPTNRRRRRRHENRKITPEVLGWYAGVKEIRHHGDGEFWEEKGGRGSGRSAWWS